MKITDVRIHALSQEMTDACWSAHEVFARQQLTLVEVRTDEGLIGVGEIWFGPQDIVCDYLKMFSELIKGMDPLGQIEISQKLLSTHIRALAASADGMACRRRCRAIIGR